MRRTCVIVPRCLLASSLAVLGSMLVAPTASASFKGANGLIAFDVTRDPCGGADPGADEGSCASTRLRAIDPRSGRRVRIPACPGADRCNNPAWSPRGALAFGGRIENTRPTGAPYRFFVAIRTGNGSQSRIVAEPGDSPAWAPDASRLVFQRLATPTAPAPDLFTVRTDGQLLERLTFQGGNYSPDWSSRNRIAFERDQRPAAPGPASTDIYTAGPDGKKLRRLTRNGRSGEPSWSPDGRRLAFSRYRRQGPSGIYVMRQDGRYQRKLASDGGSPAWSPDGRLITYLRGAAVYVVPATGGWPRRLYKEPGLDLESTFEGLGRLAWQPRRGR
jgi:Tol biopolymer transport system component